MVKLAREHVICQQRSGHVRMQDKEISKLVSIKSNFLDDGLDKFMSAHTFDCSN